MSTYKEKLPVLLTSIMLAIIFLCNSWCEPALAAVFNDLNGHWSYQAVTRAAALDLVHGYPSGQFMPDRKVSLLDSVVLLLKAEGYSDAKQNTNSQNKQTASTLKVPYAQQLFDIAVDQKIIPDDLLTAFSPNAPATRAQVASMLCRLLQLPTAEGTLNSVSLSDLNESPTAYIPYITSVINAGLMSGYPDGRFAPAQGITRGEMAALLSRLIDHNWSKLPDGRRLDGWIRSQTTGKSALNLELVSLQADKKLNLSQTVKYFSNGLECSLQQVINNRVELLLDRSMKVAYISVLDKKSVKTSDDKIRGTVKNIALGIDSFMVVNDLLCNDRVLPLAWNAVIEGNNTKQFTGFQTLKTGDFIDAYLADGKVVQVAPLATKKLSGTVKELSGPRLILTGNGPTNNKPGWFNYWESARIVDSNGKSHGDPSVGDSVQITYLDLIPNEIDDEIPLEIVDTTK